ncbi:hypothetical protein [Streptomyces virginiae]|uniref:hypothetical protein n=1 Tax=Streptomyces virginiae TaxID=1961 RepID=UPI002259564C|nr:hypothetical protein [Streptomyces virginiae]MCX4956877.1 hypothetical protein [Streptomyces virginiae]
MVNDETAKADDVAAGTGDEVAEFENGELEFAVFGLRYDRNWCLRSVERIELTSANWSDRKRSVHVLASRQWLPDPLAKKLTEQHRRVRLYLPIGNFPHGPLLDFNVTVAGEPAFLLSRKEHARLQAGYVAYLAKLAGIPMNVGGLDLNPLLIAIFGFAASSWESLLGQEDNPTDGVLKVLIRQFLGKAQRVDGQHLSVTAEIVEKWHRAIQPTRTIVRREMRANVSSATENPLLALPDLSYASVDEVERLLSALSDFLVAVSQAAPTSPAAAKLLRTFAASGSHWDAIAECVIPLKGPFLIKTEERRSLSFAVNGGRVNDRGERPGWSWKTYSRQLIVFNDAQSNHVNIRVADVNVELRKETPVLDEWGDPVKRSPDLKRATPELLAFYDSDPGRPYRIWIDVPLKVSMPAAVSRVIIFGLAATALLAFMFFVFNWLGAGGHETMTGGDIAVILVPSAIAASLLLVRETSTLSTEINKRSSLATGVVLAGLWVATLFAYGLNGIDWGR